MESQSPTTLKDRLWLQATRTDVLVSLGTALVSTGVLTWVAQRWTEATGGSWPASIFIGLGASCILALVTSFYLIAFRFFKPLPKDLSTPANDDTKFEAEQKLTNLTKSVVNLGQDTGVTLSKAVNQIEDRITATDARIESTANSFRRETEMLDGRIDALKILYEMRQLVRDIDRLTALLDRPLKQQREDRNWKDWNDRYQKFNKAVRKFAYLAHGYYPNEADILTSVDPSVYRMDTGDFSPENFPDHRTAHDFKTFRQLRSAYASLGRGIVDRIESKT